MKLLFSTFLLPSLLTNEEEDENEVIMEIKRL